MNEVIRMSRKRFVSRGLGCGPVWVDSTVALLTVGSVGGLDTRGCASCPSVAIVPHGKYVFRADLSTNRRSKKSGLEKAFLESLKNIYDFCKL